MFLLKDEEIKTSQMLYGVSMVLQFSSQIDWGKGNGREFRMTPSFLSEVVLSEGRCSVLDQMSVSSHRMLHASVVEITSIKVEKCTNCDHKKPKIEILKARDRQTDGRTDIDELGPKSVPIFK